MEKVIRITVWNVEVVDAVFAKNVELFLVEVVVQIMEEMGKRKPKAKARPMERALIERSIG